MVGVFNRPPLGILLLACHTMHHLRWLGAYSATIENLSRLRFTGERTMRYSMLAMQVKHPRFLAPRMNLSHVIQA